MHDREGLSSEQHATSIGIKLMSDDDALDDAELQRQKTFKLLSQYHGNTWRANINAFLAFAFAGMALMILGQGIDNTPFTLVVITLSIGVWLYFEWHRYKDLKTQYERVCKSAMRTQKEKQENSRI